jgi:hypothetical protein
MDARAVQLGATEADLMADLIQGALRAEELFSLDELEVYAAEFREARKRLTRDGLDAILGQGGAG